jgi:hypothetical protein
MLSYMTMALIRLAIMKTEQVLQESDYLRLVECLLLTARQGVPHLKLRSAAELAQEYKVNPKFKDNHHRVREMIKWETSKNFSTGFITGLGGLVTLPVAIPTALSASWMIQARLAAAVALVYGHDMSDARIQTLTLLCILGDTGKEVVKRAGIKLGTELTEQALSKISTEVLMQINKQVGFRLLAKAGETGMVNLVHIVPIAGGIVGGTVDAVTCRAVGHTARHVFGNVDACAEITDVEIIDDD